MCYIQKWVKTVPIKVTVAQHAFWCAGWLDRGGDGGGSAVMEVVALSSSLTLPAYQEGQYVCVFFTMSIVWSIRAFRRTRVACASVTGLVCMSLRMYERRAE